VTSIPRRKLGTTGYEISTVGLGTWALGGGGWSWSWGPQDDAQSVDTIVAAVEAGINWLDTAAEYGLGHSEEVVGQALRAIPEADRPLVFTKCGLVWDPADPMIPASPAASPASIRRECEDSLRRLGVEAIDLYQVHWPPADGTSVDEYWAAMVELRETGKVRAVGLSNHDVAQLTAAEAIGHVDSLQPPLSAIGRDAAGDVIPWCAAHGTAVIVYSPMHSGLLSGSFDPVRLAPDDWRRRESDWTEKLDANLRVADALGGIAATKGATAGSVAVAWTLAWPGVTGAIVGARSPRQVSGWIDSAALRLTDADLDAIAAAIRASGAGTGPARPA
jgi:aryl-alcohol dehydrogenase-like predicted oxidoreductase